MDPGTDECPSSSLVRLGTVMAEQSASAKLTGQRVLLLLVAATALVAVLSGLLRLGIAIPLVGRSAALHGPLFVLGVFQTVISLERATALSRGWSYLAPLLGVLGTVVSLFDLSLSLWLSSAATVVLTCTNAVMVKRQPAAFTWLPLFAGLLLFLSNLRLLLGSPVFAVIPLWQSFFVLTILAERLELSRLLKTPQWATRLLLVLSLGLSLSAFLSESHHQFAMPAFGVAMSLLALWQLRFDLARRTVRQQRLPRLVAVGVLAGAGWLLFGGLLWLFGNIPFAGPRYDAALHSVFIGYVLSMVVVHAPIILPAVARVSLPFSPLLYLPLLVLHLSLVLRIIGDLAGLAPLRLAGGIGNALTLPLLLLSAILSARVSQTPKQRTPSDSPLLGVSQ